jgi:acetylornithine deacetylase/succinyl-diaminopimelate desuccinylase-like protein
MSTPLARKAIEYAQAHRKQQMEGYQELLRIPSVSTDPAHKADIERCADWLVAEIDRLGFKNTRKIPTDGQPVVYGEWLEAGEDRPTILIYAHYDVQPIDPLDLWETPPFEPTIRDGKLYARGAIDDKSGVWINLKAIESILAVDGRLPVNVKLLFEGEEESGSPHMQPFVTAYKEMLKADALFLCDGPFAPEQPAITYSLRGLTAAEVTVSGPDHDLHSGQFGGAVHNPIHFVGKIIASFHDETGRVQIPGFYDKVQKLTDEEMIAMQDSWEITRSRWEAQAGTSRFWAGEIATTPERVTALPTLDVNGVWGGYQGPGSKTVIPSTAGFKATMRLVADQDPVEIGELFREYVFSFAPDTLDVEVTFHSDSWPLDMGLDNPAIEVVQRALEARLGQRAVLKRGGGTIPIGGMFQRELGMHISGFSLGSGGGGHPPNEHIIEEDFYLAIELAIQFYYESSDLNAI